MLVVSRKQNQSVVFPALGITVEILRVAGKAVRVGVRAPDDIRVLRGELVDPDSVTAANMDSAKTDSAKTDSARPDSSPGSSDLSGKAMHDLRNQLNKVQLAMTLLEKQLAAGRIADAEASLAMALNTFQEMEQAAGGNSLVQHVAQSGVEFKVGPFDDADDASNDDQIESTSQFGNAFQSGKTSKSGKPKRALLVEDDPNERMLLASYLRASGYEVDTAEDGQAALEYLSTQKPDAVVMDMEMPRLNGRETIQKIRSHEQFDDMKVFVVSGMEQKAMNVSSGDRGVQRWFQKPLRPEDLVNELAGLN